MQGIELLKKQIEFIAETDQLKAVLRKTHPIGMQRFENSAEHSWQAILYAITLCEHANEKIDLLKVVKMLALHDIVEIDVGDVFHYDKNLTKDLYQQELAAAERIFNILEASQAAEYLSLWKEFEAKQTAEAKYAAAVDRMLPIILNANNQGGSWHQHKITVEQVLEKNAHIKEGSTTLWEMTQQILNEAHNKGYIKKTTHKQTEDIT